MAAEATNFILRAKYLAGVRAVDFIITCPSKHTALPLCKLHGVLQWLTRAEAVPPPEALPAWQQCSLLTLAMTPILAKLSF